MAEKSKPPIAVLIGIILASVALVGGFWLKGHQDWKDAHPEHHQHRIGYTFLPGADPNWKGFPEALDAISDTLAEEWPKEPELQEFWVWVVPHDGDIEGRLIAGVDPKKVNGTVDTIRYLGIFNPKYIVIIRQIRNNQGAPRPPKNTALFHEVAMHLVPYRLGAGWFPYTQEEHRNEGSVWGRDGLMREFIKRLE